MRRASHHANLNPVEARSGGWMRSLGSKESDPRQGDSVRQEAKNSVTWSVVGKGELHSNHSLLKRTRDRTVPDNPVFVVNPANRTPDPRFRPISSLKTPQLSIYDMIRPKVGFRESAHTMSVIGYARVSTAEGRQVPDRQLDALSEAGCERAIQSRISNTWPWSPGGVPSPVSSTGIQPWLPTAKPLPFEKNRRRRLRSQFPMLPLPAVIRSRADHAASSANGLKSISSFDSRKKTSTTEFVIRKTFIRSPFFKGGSISRY